MSPARPAAWAAHNIDTGRVLAREVRAAATRWARAVGLIGRRRLEPGEALWIAPSRGVHTCGMRFAIDLVALDRDGVVVDCVARLRPWRVRLPRRGTAGVLELAAGAVEASGTRVGDRIAFVSVCPASASARGGDSGLRREGDRQG